VGNYAKFNPPTIANGRVYVPTFSQQLVVYGLLNAVQPAQNFTVSASPLQASVTAGGTATFTITVTPSGGLNGTVNLSCSVVTAANSAPRCSLNPTSITVNAVPLTSIMTVNTTDAQASVIPMRGVFYATLLPIGVLALLGTGFTPRRKKLLAVFLFCLMVSSLLLFVSCGGRNSSASDGESLGGGGSPDGTPPGTYEITVTPTVGTQQHSTTVALTVQ
jgi:4-amino-4-deoxy-L-arabinose transferase-like glycosyltransferase